MLFTKQTRRFAALSNSGPMRRDQLEGSYDNQSATPHRQGTSSSRQVMTGDRCNERCKSVVKSVVICVFGHFFCEKWAFFGFWRDFGRIFSGQCESLQGRANHLRHLQIGQNAAQVWTLRETHRSAIQRARKRTLRIFLPERLALIRSRLFFIVSVSQYRQRVCVPRGIIARA